MRIPLLLFDRLELELPVPCAERFLLVLRSRVGNSDARLLRTSAWAWRYWASDWATVWLLRLSSSTRALSPASP
ncbi:hypothetical protein D3C71_1651370 [compost metagenome]